MSQRFDCIIVGGGPGGYVAAIRARQLGLETALVEREHLGGICLNWGCIPTKALLRASEIRHLMREAETFGFEVGDVRVDLPKVVDRSRKVAKRLSGGVRSLMKKNGVQVVEGHGRLAGPGRVAVTDANGGVQELEAPHVVLATGARARTLPGLEPDGERIWSYREAMVPESMPASVLVVGSGAIGVEFASFYRDLGAEVTIVELLPQILPAEDEEIAKFARRAFEKQGIAIHTGAQVKGARPTASGIEAEIATSDGQLSRLEVERLIVAVGITGNVEDLGLEGTGVRVERGEIQVDAWGATGEPGVYAIGDVAGPPHLAHKANHEGVACIERIAGVDGVHPLDRDAVPGCTYCRPQIASVGLTERAAREAGREIRVGRFPFQGNGKALAYGDTQGLVKTVFDAHSGELLGAHMVGPEVTEMIQGFAIARTLETTEAELMRTIFPHPTLSESMHEAVLAAYDRALHI
ncbi:MAG: dihydrolipoyl dehydrogenase [Myxococcota bacterium]